MNHRSKSEIDVLLREAGRVNSLRPRNEGNVLSSEDHLDADAISAFAEGALPAPIRLQYADHLADCGSCRRLVTDLALSSDARAERPPVLGVSPGIGSRLLESVRSTFVAFFTPAVLRYAVPALAVLAVMAVGLIATRNRQNEALVARNDESRAGSAPRGGNEVSAELSNNGTIAKGTATVNADQPQVAASDSNVVKGNKLNETNTFESDSTRSSEGLKKEKRAGGPKPDVTSEVSNRAAGVVDSPKQSPAGNNQSATTRTGGREELASPSGKPRDQANASSGDFAIAPESGTTNNVQSEEPSNYNRQGELASMARSAAKGSPSAKREMPALRRNEAADAGGARARTASQPMQSDSKHAPDRAASLPAAPSEKRRASGHTFKRMGNVWVDTAYSSSYSVINLTRGSERYRSLVADEPEIRSMAEQLGGEVILVWKGKAYHIR